MLSYFKGLVPAPFVSLPSLGLSQLNCIAFLFLLMLLQIVHVRLSLLPLFREKLCKQKLVIACLVGIGQYLRSFQMVNFMQESSGFKMFLKPK